MCQQQQVESVSVGRAEEQLQRKLDNMKMSGMPERAIKTVERLLKRRQKAEQEQQLQQQQQDTVTVNSERLIKVGEYEEDVLAVVTRYTKIALEMVSAYTEEFQTSKTFA